MHQFAAEFFYHPLVHFPTQYIQLHSSNVKSLLLTKEVNNIQKIIKAIHHIIEAIPFDLVELNCSYCHLRNWEVLTTECSSCEKCNQQKSLYRKKCGGRGRNQVWIWQRILEILNWWVFEWISRWRSKKPMRKQSKKQDKAYQ